MGSTIYALSIVLTALMAPQGCRLGTYAELVEQLQGGKSEVIVFSTWCAPCREHVRRAGPDTLLVGAFDEPTRLSRAVRQLNPSAVCLLGEELVRQLHIKSVPAHLYWRDGALVSTVAAVAP